MTIRYYDPVLKDFISEDSIGFIGGLNINLYVDRDTVSLNAPLRLEASEFAKRIGYSQDLIGVVTSGNTVWSYI